MSEDPFEPRPIRNRGLGDDIPSSVEEPEYEREDDGPDFER